MPLVNPSSSGGLGGSTGSTDKAALRANGIGGSTAQASALIIDDTTGRVSRSGNGGISVQGTNTNDSAAAGDVGEYISATLVSGSAVSLVNNTAKTVTSVSLTAGDWDVAGVVIYSFAGSTTVTEIDADFSLVTNTYDSTLGRYTASNFPSGTTLGGLTPGVTAPRSRFSFSSTTSVFLVAFSSFAVSTGSAYGFIGARRVR